MIALAVSNGDSRPWEADRREHVVQGRFAVTDDRAMVLTTLLGSCVAACMYDPVAGVGGMNHFLLPGDDGEEAEGLRYGVHAMELLVNGLLKLGARRDRLQAKLFGGARMVESFGDIGRRNVIFAERFLATEKIIDAGGDLGGVHARRVQFWAVQGRARQLLVQADHTAVFEAERQTETVNPMPDDAGALELL